MDLDMEQDKINYTISFLTEWHAGSGLTAGAEADSVVIKDQDGFPYIPGKTLKGLFVDSFRDFKALGIEGFNDESFNPLFGFMDKNTKVTSPGSLFFSNVILPEEEKSAIGKDHVDFLYRNIASTAIESTTGVAKKSSLRVMEVCIPLSLEGYIQGADDSDRQLIDQLARYIRNIGANRNRGLGRCSIKLK
ncbi:CRISPR/Cas system CSM-associated protein Csm3, group 7 of RAMP superfamily [Algoriphagus alkaliphilus]|uniref:CRISPR/Cas system CSM-associated protein Csm3, group 7 of RAMP superfamily n=1 Tax=Algoriphagus alkaliphilus TaxID=279824 RepID=A0A1G5X2A3_9BACT|nr:RAMP superfamily CRISPR-associated protein [Algoriphagus alkaliphilus]SDA64310.1 CRISPR/Cas system CSM-associated protein Csm3, group 7 of RAMP superfamily [Algoriphagus alkaliphilus]